jgi:hypothetical protein
VPPEPGPIFVGGTGRSGTTLVARLIAADERFALVPVELQLHAAPGGLADALAGRVSFAWLLPRLRGHWYARPAPGGGKRGLEGVCPRPRYDALVDALEAEWDAGPAAAAARFVEEVAGVSSPWVEMTPYNLRAAPGLAAMFPGARFVHATRSGLDTAASYREHGWAPDDVFDCLLWWADRLAEAARGAAAVAGRVEVVDLADLADDHDEVLARLAALLGAVGTDPVKRVGTDPVKRVGTDRVKRVGTDPVKRVGTDPVKRVGTDPVKRVGTDPGEVAVRWRAWAAAEIAPRRAAVGRWRERVPTADHARLVALYRRVVQRLERAGVAAPRDDLAAGELRSGLATRAWVTWRVVRWRAVAHRRWSWRRARWREPVARLLGRRR